MRKRTAGWMLAAVLALAAAGGRAEPVVYAVNPSKVVATADVGVHGQFLEHIFNSVHGGLWGDLVLNPSLESNSGASPWVLKDDTVTLPRPATNVPLVFGDERWTDYEFSLEARRDEGGEGFLIIFRAAGDRHYRVNFGGWANKEHGVEKMGGPIRMLRVPGTIEPGRWYKVRVVCAGAKFEVFLDDARVFEFEDRERPFRSGGIGMNVWNTKASFRNLKVTAPDGKVLFAGLPSREDMAQLPAYWNKVGGRDDGFLSTQHEAPLNNATSAVLNGRRADGVFGLQQGPMNLVRGETYEGSLYLRSPKGSTALVRLLDAEGKPAFERVFEKLPADWRKTGITFKADRDVPEATFQVLVKGEGVVEVDLIRLFPKSALDAGGFRPDVLKAIADLKPDTIRYPGGCFASAYRWKDGVGPVEKRTYFPNVIWDDRDPSQMGTDEFMDLCRRVGAKPIIAINMHRGVEETLEWMEYCLGDATTTWGRVRAANGHPEPYPVEVWEIDNETWGMGVERYAEGVKKFAPAMKARYPHITIAACGSYGYDDGKGSSNGWNQRLLNAAAKDIDLLSIHYYNGIDYAQDHIEDPWKFEQFMRDDIGAMIRASANPKMKIYCSEWGQMNIEWRSGLYTGGLLNGFERIGGDLLPLTCPAVWLQRVGPRGNYHPRWGSSHILFDHRTWFPAPTYVVQKLWREHFAPKVLATEGPAKRLNVVASLTADGRTMYFKAVNTEDRPAEVELRVGAGFKVGQAALQVIAPGDLKARNSLEKPAAIAPVKAEAQVQGQVIRFTVPANAVAALTLQ